MIAEWHCIQNYRKSEGGDRFLKETAPFATCLLWLLANTAANLCVVDLGLGPLDWDMLCVHNLALYNIYYLKQISNYENASYFLFTTYFLFFFFFILQCYIIIIRIKVILQEVFIKTIDWIEHRLAILINSVSSKHKVTWSNHKWLYQFHINMDRISRVNVTFSNLFYLSSSMLNPATIVFIFVNYNY